MKFVNSEIALNVLAGEKIGFIEFTELPDLITKAMHKNSKLVYENEPVEILQVFINDTSSVFIKFVDDFNSSKMVMFYDVTDPDAVLWANIIDGASEYGETNKHEMKVLHDTFIYLEFVDVMIAVENNEYLLFDKNDKYSKDPLPLYAKTLELENK